MKTVADQNPESLEMPDEDEQPESGGFMKFYGLYWKKVIFLSHCSMQDGGMSGQFLLGRPSNWTGSGRRAIDFDPDRLWMNFWKQKGVYVLYDEQLVPVYVGQAGLSRKKSKGSEGRNLGERLHDHANGKYRNGWMYFSWFGFLEAQHEAKLKGRLRNASQGLRLDPGFDFRPSSSKDELNNLLDSFEAILIEAFTPRFNARGGNLKGSFYVDQFEGAPALD